MIDDALCTSTAHPTVVPVKSIGIEIMELIGLGFFGHICDVAHGAGIISGVSPRSGRSSGGDPRLATPNRCASAPDSEAEPETR
jgi:hypothetical protein